MHSTHVFDCLMTNVYIFIFNHLFSYIALMCKETAISKKDENKKKANAFLLQTTGCRYRYTSVEQWLCRCWSESCMRLQQWFISAGYFCTIMSKYSIMSKVASLLWCFT